ncbi:hypothetical protein NE237_028823 [Protea cynaroides]|uniref:VQ domain-containing protein n=1 Tax=Protea cynaroides TaxID=273540 RepID=A0A9Q0JU74_9MAGN|nr:hypothetical protein NE237_028823 [Protea cynaroides]
MEKNSHSSGESNNNNNSSSSSNFQQTQLYHPHQNNSSNNSRDQYFRQLNKISHKISKDSRPAAPIRKYPIDHLRHIQQQQQPQQQSQEQPQQQQHHQSQLQPQQQHQHQPPVYNINKNDFRDVVQKLTGSPAHERSFSTPPPIHPPKPPSSRLQRIRPPPLAHLSPRPPPPLPTTAGGNNNGRSISPLSPLPPFPTVHAAAESPISAYMRYLQSSISTVDNEPKRFSSGISPLASPRWNNPNSLQPLVSPRLQPRPLPPSQQVNLPSPTGAMSPSQFLMPSSPLPFGKLPSPLSPYPLLSPTFLFSPTGGQLGFPQFPPSPRLPVPSPRWRDL